MELSFGTSKVSLLLWLFRFSTFVIFFLLYQHFFMFLYAYWHVRQKKFVAGRRSVNCSYLLNYQKGT